MRSISDGKEGGLIFDCDIFDFWFFIFGEKISRTWACARAGLAFSLWIEKSGKGIRKQGNFEGGFSFCEIGG